MKRVIVGFLVISISLLIKSCDTADPPDNKSLTLKLEDVSCTEAWIELTTTNLQLPATVTLKQNDQTRATIHLIKADTLLYIDSLLPNQTYTFQSVIQSINQSSNEVTATTMDTTSHNFTWQTWTFGEHSSSVLYDVAIINENNIIAVGEIYMNDSLGQPDINAYNIVRWNGGEWTIGRIAFTGGCHIIYPPIRSIWSFSENDIWFASGGSLVHFDGNEYYNDCRMNSIITPPLNKIWGTLSSNLYVVGSKGTIIRYNGTLWWRMGRITNVDIQDIWGMDNGGSGQLILCAASNAIEPGEHKIIKINNSSSIDTISWIPNRKVHSVWMDSKYKLFACGDGVFINNSNNIWEKQNELTFVFTERVRGKLKNDLFVVGDFGLLAHYNGVTWREYPEAASALVYTSLDFKNNLMVTVGYTQTKAVIQFMIRN